MKHLGDIAWNISWRDTDEWDAALRIVTDIFSVDSVAINEARRSAERVRELMKAVDPFIQKQTAIACPHCVSVCCIDRHGSYDLHDLVYAFCLDLPIPRYESHRKETDPCQFLASTGCRLPRHERPFRCTWYVCEALIAHMQTLSARQVREFNAMFQVLQLARIEMLQQL
jgi:hypothetical protein